MNGDNQNNFRCKLNKTVIERRKIWETRLDIGSEKKNVTDILLRHKSI